MKNETILIIGGTGFIGKNMVQYMELHEPENNFIVVSRNQSDSLGKENFKYITGDYGDRDFLCSIFQSLKITKVLHFANSSVPVSSNANIIGDIENNLISTLVLLDVMKEFGCKFIAYLSSGGAVYGESGNGAFAEEDICLPISAYGITKLNIEQYIKFYQRNHGIDYIILRLSNLYGQYHTSNQQGFINIAVRKALNREKITIWGNGEQEKDYIFVEDVVSIIVKLLNNDVRNDILNIGSGKTYTLVNILNKVALSIPGIEVIYEESKPSDILKFSLDVTKLNNLINHEMTAIDLGLERTIVWEKLVNATNFST